MPQDRQRLSEIEAGLRALKHKFDQAGQGAFQKRLGELMQQLTELKGEQKRAASELKDVGNAVSSISERLPKLLRHLRDLAKKSARIQKDVAEIRKLYDSFEKHQKRDNDLACQLRDLLAKEDDDGKVTAALNLLVDAFSESEPEDDSSNREESVDDESVESDH